MAGKTGSLRPPDALTLPVVWACVPGTSPDFRGCSLCLDKLGLSLRPLVEHHPGHSQPAGAQQVQLLQRRRPQLPVTETISLPTASVLEVVEGAEALARAGRQQQSAEAPAAVRWRPFARVFGHSPETAAERRSAGTEGTRPPQRHVVALRIHSAVAAAAGAGRGGRRDPPQGPAAAAPAAAPQDVHLALALPHAADVKRLVERLHEFRRYARALEFAPFLSWLAATAAATTEGKSQQPRQPPAPPRGGAAAGEEALLAELLAPAPACCELARDRWRLPQLGLGPDGRPLWRQQPRPMTATANARWPRLFRSQSVS